jgi:predicted MFS family arabinose efflux permease
LEQPTGKTEATSTVERGLSSNKGNAQGVVTMPLLASKPAASVAWVMTLLLSVLLLGLIDVQIFSPILPLLSKDFRISIATAGIAVTAYSITSALWALFIGPLSDRFGRVIFLRLAAGFFATASMLAFFAQRFEVYISARVLAGLAGGTMSACIIALVADIVPYEKRGRAMGWVGAMYSVAAVAGVPIGALLADSFGWRSIYLVFAAPALLLAIVMHRTQKAVDAEYVNNGGGANHRLSSGRNTNGILGAVQSQLREYGCFWMNSSTRHGLLLSVAYSSAATSLLTYLGAWLVGPPFNMPVKLIGVVFLTTGLAALLGAFTGGWLADKLGKRRLIGLSTLALALLMFLCYFVANQAHVFAFCIAGALIMALREGPYQALITELVSAHERGAYIAMRNSTAQLAIASAAGICGVLFQNFGFIAVAAFAGISSLGAFVLVFFVMTHSTESTLSGDS